MAILARQLQRASEVRPAGADLAETLALTVVFALAGVGALIAIATLLVAPKPIPGFDLSQRQSVETALYLTAFGIVLPLSVLLVPRVADAVAVGPNGRGLELLCAVLAGCLAVAVVAVRVADVSGFYGGTRTLLVVLLGWWAVAIAAVLRAMRPRPWAGLLQRSHLASIVWRLDAVLVLCAAMTVVHTESVSLVAIALAVVVVPVAIVASRRLPDWQPSRRLGLVGDAAAIFMVLLAVPDLVVITPEDPALTATERLLPSIMQFHHDFIVGPANQVLGGATVLVDTASQYGVGSIYFVVAWFKLASAGYGSFALLDGVLTAAVFAAGYVLMRLCGSPRLVAFATLAIGVVALVFNREYPVGFLPQEGPLRFGLPMGVIVATVAGARWPRHARLARAAVLAIIGLSSLWALEALAYTLATFTALTCFEAYLGPPGARAPWLARRAGLVAAACVVSHLLLAIATLLRSGQLPDWGQYLAFLHAFLFGELGNLTYDFAHWSAGLAVGAAYLAAGIGLGLVVLRRPDVVERERLTLLALAGITAYGIVSFVYFVDRSAEHVVPYVSLQALLAGGLWLTVLLRSRASQATKTTALALVLSACALMIAVAWSSVGTRFEHSALGHVLPGGSSTRAALERLRHFPPLNSRAPEGERLLAKFMPGQRRPVVLVEPDLTTEILMRSRRSNRLPLADPREDDFTPVQRLPGLRKAVADLRPGDRILTAQPVLAGLVAVKADPASPLLRRPSSATSTLQLSTLLMLERRFRLKPIYRGRDGYVVAELAPRSS